MNLLEVSHLTKSFDALTAVDDLSFSVDQGSLVGLIGPNGSGKSTLLNLIAGFQRPNRGDIHFDGKRITNLPPNEIAQVGLVKGFQTPRNFMRMTVFENVLLSPRNQKGEALRNAPIHSHWTGQEEEHALSILPWLETLKLRGNATDKASEVSGGQMKLLDILRGVMTHPRLLLLDEPTAGVAPGLAEEIFTRILEVRTKINTGFFIIEHRVETLLRYVDRVMVMHLGKVIYDGPPDQVINDPRVKEVYLGQ
jgi:branched-chain amino acid transport system ATP-binding protein